MRPDARKRYPSYPPRAGCAEPFLRESSVFCVVCFRFSSLSSPSRNYTFRKMPFRYKAHITAQQNNT
jgi:hypothetical protein